MVTFKRGTKGHSHQEAYRTHMGNNNNPLPWLHTEKEKGKDIRKRLDRRY